ncbi:hypothetical protein KOI35_10965 [Actinoplanes bogorensis]|uniref:Uncharacterized protein n=1 Tax=Paractinoplanes bogorensis TaxID=1610840 RepID=A0ABS5YKM5_9ACTN|nr:hypothetical protein [Actinoplanes bogorensis]MBU2664010.1 hypothetical protein [Actinoplanes bogorensis]
MIDELRTGWPEALLTGQYTLRTYGGTLGGEILDDLGQMFTVGLHRPGNDRLLKVTVDGHPVLTVLNDRDGVPPRIKAVAEVPWLSLVKRPDAQSRPDRRTMVFGPLLQSQLSWGTRLRRSVQAFRTPPPPDVWDVVDDRLGRVIGRLAGPVDEPPGTKRVIFRPDGWPAALLMEDPYGRLTIVVDTLAAARIFRVHAGHRIDVTTLTPTGLDPRLVLACAMLQFAYLSDK